MNGVAREFWAEVYDLRTLVEDRRGWQNRDRRSKATKVVLTRRPTRRPLR
jgi:hypothetical protein